MKRVMFVLLVVGTMVGCDRIEGFFDSFACTTTITSGNPSELQKALKNAQENGKKDVICIDKTYHLTRPLVYMPKVDTGDCSKDLIIRGLGNAVLDGGERTPIMLINTTKCKGEKEKPAKIVIEGIRFQNGKGANIGVGLAIFTFKDDVVVRGNVFLNNQAVSTQVVGFNTGKGNAQSDAEKGSIKFIPMSSYGAGLFIKAGTGKISIENNIFQNNVAGSDAAPGFGGALRAGINSGSILVANNLFVNNTAYGNGGALDVGTNQGTIWLINNTFSDNSARVFGGAAFVFLNSENATVNIYNNIFWKNVLQGSMGADLFVNNDGNNNGMPSPVNLAYNLFTPSTQPINFSSAPKSDRVFIKLAGGYNVNIPQKCSGKPNYGNLQADPLFVGNGNFHLSPRSPALGTGCAYVPMIPKVNIEGKERSGSVNMGAY